MNAEKTKDWIFLLRALTYGIQQTPDPLQYVDRAIFEAVDAAALKSSPEQYLAAVRTGLASNEDLSVPLFQNKSDAVLRDFLRSVERKLVERLK